MPKAPQHLSHYLDQYGDLVKSDFRALRGVYLNDHPEALLDRALKQARTKLLHAPPEPTDRTP